MLQGTNRGRASIAGANDGVGSFRQGPRFELGTLLAGQAGSSVSQVRLELVPNLATFANATPKT